MFWAPALGSAKATGSTGPGIRARGCGPTGPSCCWTRGRGGYDGDPSVCAHLPTDRTRLDPRDSAPHMPRSVVVDPGFDWGGDAPPGIAMADSIIYETHVRGLTKQHPRCATR